MRKIREAFPNVVHCRHSLTSNQAKEYEVLLVRVLSL